MSLELIVLTNLSFYRTNGIVAAQASLRLGRQGNQLEHPTHTNSKLYDRVGNEQFSENKSWESIRVDPKTAFEPYPNP